MTEQATAPQELFLFEQPGFMRALLIDPATQTITEGYIEPGLQAMYATIGCAAIDIVCLASGARRSIDLVVDDEGLFADDQRFFRIGEHQIGGRALVLDSNADGETIGTEISRAKMQSAIEWVEHHAPQRPTVTEWI